MGPKLFHVVVVRRDPKTGKRIDDYRAQITATPATHREALTIVSKKPGYADRIRTVDGRRYRASYELEPFVEPNVVVGPGKPGQKFREGNVDIETTLHPMRLRGLATPNLDVAQTILKQLNQRSLVMMIGAKDFMGAGAEDGHSGSLKFRFSTRSADGSNSIVIKLMPSDTYRVEFWSIRGTSVKLKKAVDDVYADALRKTIEYQTGLSLRLW